MTKIALSRSATLRGVLLAMLFAVSPAVQKSGAAADAPADALCRRLWEDHLAARKALQPERLAFTKDAIAIYPDASELRGRDAIQAHLVKTLAGLKIFEVGFKLERCEVVGGHAYTFGIVDERFQEGAAPPARQHARFAAVWERQPDETWQVAHFLVNYRKL